MLTKGLYLVGDERYVKRNVKTLEIDYQIPENKNQIGIRFSKQYECVVLTAVILGDFMQKHKIQFIIKEDCNAKNIHDCNHYMLDGFREPLINALKMLKIQTVKDLMDFEQEIN
jgi:hypothetical protein